MSANNEFHPVANLFPLLEGKDFDKLAQDIREHGLLEPIVLHEGKILDGRNRFRACKAAGVEPRFRPWEPNGSSPISFVLSENLHRRHLTPSQLAAIGVEAEKLFAQEAKKRQAHGKTAPGVTLKERIPEALQGQARDKAAKVVGVNPRYVSDAKKIGAADPEKLEQVRRGEKTIPDAKRELQAKAKPKTPGEAVARDKTGYPIPALVLPDWERAEAKKELLQRLREIRREVDQAITEPAKNKQPRDRIWVTVPNTVLSQLGNALAELETLIPYAVCTSCAGHGRDRCNLCKGRGYLDKFSWDRYVPRETKAVRERAAQKQ